MFFAPFPLLFSWLVGLLSLALLVGGAYLTWAWFVGVVVGTGWLVDGLAVLLWTFVGRWLVLRFHHRGLDEPGVVPPRRSCASSGQMAPCCQSPATGRPMRRRSS